MAESNENDAALKRTNWADEDDEDDGNDVEIGGSSVAQVGQQPILAGAASTETNDAQGVSAQNQQPRTFIPNKPRQKRERNIYGDFIVTKINVKVREVVQPQNEEGKEED